MSDVMTGRLVRLLPVAAVLWLGIAIVDANSATAQGPLRRLLGNRIRARMEPLVQPPPPTLPPPTLPRASNGLRPVAPYAGPTPPNQAPQPRLAPQPNPAQQRPTTQPQPPNQPAFPSQSANSPSIGIEVEEYNVGFRGVRVIRFRPNSQAEAAGLRLGDIIVGVQGRGTSTITDVAQALSSLAPGQVAQLRIVRSQSLASGLAGASQIPTEYLQVPLVAPQVAVNPIPTTMFPSTMNDDVHQQARYEQPTSDATLGVVLRNAIDRQGAIVQSVAPRSPGEVAEMKVGDRIVSIDGRMVQTATSVVEVLNRSKPGDQHRFQWVRGDQLREANVVLAGPDGISPDALSAASSAGNQAHGNQAHQTAEPTVGSFFNGIGSTLGNLFNETSKPAAANAPADASGPSILMRPATSGESKAPGESKASGGSATSNEPVNARRLEVTRELPEPSSTSVSEELPMPAPSRDPLEFGDEELTAPGTGFGDNDKPSSERVQPISIVETTDPPSLGSVTPPTGSPNQATTSEDQTIQRLRSEIERLRSRIQQLEKPSAP